MSARKKKAKNPNVPGEGKYREVHWGEKGPVAERRRQVPNPHDLPLIELGELVSVTYRTKKGGDRTLTDYEHEFEGPLPLLVFNKGGLIIAGGKYKITTRGIVG